MRTTMMRLHMLILTDTATTEIYTLSLHDALPIWWPCWGRARTCAAASRGSGPTSPWRAWRPGPTSLPSPPPSRSEEHTSELQSQSNLVCRLLLEKQKQLHLRDGAARIIHLHVRQF